MFRDEYRYHLPMVGKKTEQDAQLEIYTPEQKNEVKVYLAMTGSAG